LWAQGQLSFRLPMRPFFEPWHPIVKHVAITLERLPAIFNDFTIAHLSDFHYHPFFTAKPIARAVLLVN
jgi:predicted MPP superfamily phosphohydrolase